METANTRGVFKIQIYSVAHSTVLEQSNVISVLAGLKFYYV